VTVLGGYCARPESLTLITCIPKSAKVLRSRTLWRLSGEDILLDRLAQDFEHMAAELGPCIQEEHAIVGQRHLARHRHVAPANQPRIREGVVGVRHGRGGTKTMRSPGRLVSIPSCTRIVDMPMKRPYTWVTRIAFDHGG
jgi:hypothetical protein